jgi:hypothetical protein
LILRCKHLVIWGGTTLALAVAAIIFRVCCRPDETKTLPAGSIVGLSYGIAGGFLILIALALNWLRLVPNWWFIFSRAVWLKGHIWLGLLSFVLILCHSGLRFGGSFEQVLYAVYLLVVLTGIFGLILQQFVPRLMTRAVPCEVPFEQIHYICAALRDKADMQIDDKCKCSVAATSARIRQWYTNEMRPFLAWPLERKSLLNDAAKTGRMLADLRELPGAREQSLPDLLARLEEYCSERRRLARQESLHWLLHSWLYVHVPLSYAMTVMMLAHVVMTLLVYY